MPNKAEPMYAGEFLASQGNGQITKDQVVLITSATPYQPGDILGQITASLKYALLNPAAGDGSQNAAGINYAYSDATVADTKGTVVTREAEVNGAELNYYAYTAPQITTLTTQLAAKFIIIRAGK